jgi:hypothetical protein
VKSDGCGATHGPRRLAPSTRVAGDSINPTDPRELRQQKIHQTIKERIDSMASTRQYVPVAAQTITQKRNGSRPVGRPTINPSERRDNLIQGAFTRDEELALLAYKRRHVQPNDGAALRHAVVETLRKEGLLSLDGKFLGRD